MENKIAMFSTWLLIWFFCFIIGIIKANPLFFLIFAYIYTLIGNVIIYLSPIYAYDNYVKYIIINIVIKVIPIFIIITFYHISFNKLDIYFGLFLFLIYIILMIFININPFIYYYELVNKGFIQNNKDYLPFYVNIYDFIINNKNK